MPYLDNLFGAHINRLDRSMDRATQRQAMLMENLANVNTPNYKRQDMDFNIALQDEIDRQNGVDRSQLARSGGSVGNASSLRSDGNNVDLEFEVLSITETEQRYDLLTDMTGKYFQGLKNAIREGR